MKPFTISSNLKKLALILSDNEYHSGTDIGTTLGITRSGVWKLIKQLNALGIEIESVTNKGYRVVNSLELMDKNKIRKLIAPANLERINKLQIFDDLPSTNDYLVAEGKHSKGQNLVCIAERQTAGRGRLGRTWVSPFAENIYLSLLWNFPFDISELGGLNVVIGVSVAEAIQSAADIQDIQLKWPNDIFWQDNKLGGILIDITGEYSGGCAAVIGIGLNIRMSKAHAEKIRKAWGNLADAAREKLSRNKIAGVLIDKLIVNLISFQNEGISSFIKKWNGRDYLRGKPIVVTSSVKTIKGVAEGINQQGHLMIRDARGELVAITTGDASIGR